MIDTARRSQSDELSSQVGALIRQFWHQHFQEFSAMDSWAPAINLYRLPSRVEVCVDLAGIQLGSVDLRLEPGRLIIRGSRAAPEPTVDAHETMHIVAMEINHGPFCRVVPLPENVNLMRVQTQYTQGLMWIRLPFREPG